MPLENALELRSVTSLLVDEFGSPVQYRVPAYQRGFRWTNRQVARNSLTISGISFKLTMRKLPFIAFSLWLSRNRVTVATT